MCVNVINCKPTQQYEEETHNNPRAFVPVSLRPPTVVRTSAFTRVLEETKYHGFTDSPSLHMNSCMNCRDSRMNYHNSDELTGTTIIVIMKPCEKKEHLLFKKHFEEMHY